MLALITSRQVWLMKAVPPLKRRCDPGVCVSYGWYLAVHAMCVVCFFFGLWLPGSLRGLLVPKAPQITNLDVTALCVLVSEVTWGDCSSAELTAWAQRTHHWQVIMLAVAQSWCRTNCWVLSH